MVRRMQAGESLAQVGRVRQAERESERARERARERASERKRERERERDGTPAERL